MISMLGSIISGKLTINRDRQRVVKENLEVRILLRIVILFILFNTNLCFCGEGNTMFCFNVTEKNLCEAVVDLEKVSDYKVQERLFGKFTENIGTNIYGGFWGQILNNPSLEPISVCLERKGEPWHERVEFRRYTNTELPASHSKIKFPYKWFGWNWEDCVYSLKKDAYNTSHSVYMKVNDFPADEFGAGIRQPIFLPLHRENNYEISFYIKQAGAPIVAQLTDIRGKKVLGRAVFDPYEGTDWVKRSGTLELRDFEEEQGEALWFCLGLAGTGEMMIDQVSLFPSDHVQGFDPEVIRLLKEQKIKILRFPGGNYVSGYHWKDDLVPMDKRVTRKNPAWNRCDPHHVGTDEHIRLCRLIGAEPLICVNAGNGTPREAADWVEYCNGGSKTKWGKKRAERGHPEPYNVKVWEVGNELWGSWQIGHCNAQEYARRYREFYTAMKAADPSIYLLATGDPSGLEPEWNEVLIRDCSDILHSLTLHFLCSNNALSSPEYAYLSQMGYSWFFEDAFFRRLHNMGKKAGIDLKIAITEEMIFNGRSYHPHPATLAEALFYIGTLTSAIRTQGIVEIFTHSAILNHGGNMTKENARVYTQPVYYALQEVQRLSGTQPVGFSLSCPFSDAPDWQDWAGEERKKFPLVDFMPLLGKNSLDIILVNRSPRATLPVKIRIKGGKFAKKARLFELTGESFMARNDLLFPDRVKPRQGFLKLKAPDEIRIDTKPASLYVISLFR